MIHESILKDSLDTNNEGYFGVGKSLSRTRKAVFRPSIT